MADYNRDCVFCKISKKEIPVEFIYENDNFFAMPDKNPAVPGHTLIIPKNHSENVFDISHDDLKKVISVAKDLSKKIISENNATGVNLLNASGIDAEQSVFHFHLHIVPRRPNDGFGLWLEAGL